MASLDFSYDKLDASHTDSAGSVDVSALVDKASLGSRTQDGLYEVKDWDFGEVEQGDDNHVNDIISRALNSDGPAEKKPSSSFGSSFGSFFARLTGSKILTEADLKPVLEAMKQHLMKKNVAKDIAEKVCEGVGEGLVGKKVGSFQSAFNIVFPVVFLIIRVMIATNTAFRTALSNSLTRILTPKTSTDLLLSIRTKLSSPLPSTQQRMPYSITFVGVNGVGKSTNLSKVCFWLVQNGLRVLIAACDTFRFVMSSFSLIRIKCVHRSGAVEQLRVHVRNLSMLSVDGPTGSKGRVELFERGYGKDAAAIAKEAISHGIIASCFCFEC
jgi:signal recognition particle receptor subunit alpha